MKTRTVVKRSERFEFFASTLCGIFGTGGVANNSINVCAEGRAADAVRAEETFGQSRIVGLTQKEIGDGGARESCHEGRERQEQT